MLRLWLIKKLKGFSSVEEAIDSIEDAKMRNYILTRAVKRLFNTIDADDILKAGAGGQWLIEGNLMPQGKKDLLIAEAKNFLSSDLWKALRLDIKYQANRRMYMLSKTENDLIAGKLWLFTLDAIRNRLERMEKGSAESVIR